MTRIGLSHGFALVALAPLGATAQDQHVHRCKPESLKWAAAPPALPKGAQIAVLSGDPGKRGTVRHPAEVPCRIQGAPTHPTDAAHSIPTMKT